MKTIDKVVYDCPSTEEIIGPPPQEKFKRIVYDTTKWGIKTYYTKKNNKIWRGAGLTTMSFYLGSLLPGEQTKVAKSMNLLKTTFTKYSVTSCYAIATAIELPLFLGSQYSNNHYDDVLFFTSFGAGLAINATRAYFAFRKNNPKPSPSISLSSLGCNLFHYGSKGARSLWEKYLPDKRFSLKKFFASDQTKNKTQI